MFCLYLQFLYDSEKSKRDEDILKDIEKGVRLKHVKTNDRSKPNLRGKIYVYSIQKVIQRYIF